MKILIVGPGGSGKDTVAQYIKESVRSLSYDPTTASTSRAIAFAIADLWKNGYYEPSDDGLGGSKEEIVWRTRTDNRNTWMYVGNVLLSLDHCALVKWCLGRGNDIVTGVRTTRELEHSRSLFDLIIWVDRDRVQPDDIEFDWPICDIVINNNGTLTELRTIVDMLFSDSKFR